MPAVGPAPERSGTPGVQHSESKASGAASCKGAITGKDILLQGFTILRLWGPRTYLRCLRATLSRGSTPFLAVVSEAQRIPRCVEEGIGVGGLRANRSRSDRPR